MTIEHLAAVVLDACEKEGVDHMLTGAFAHGLYGIPRSTKDVDVVLSLGVLSTARSPALRTPSLASRRWIERCRWCMVGLFALGGKDLLPPSLALR